MNATRRASPLVVLPAWLRIVREPITVPEGAGAVRIREPEDLVKLLRPIAAAEETEVFWAVLLNSQSVVRGIVEVSRGLLNSTLIHPREVFRLAIAYGCAGIIVAHNHPSGETRRQAPKIGPLLARW